ncbi:hypothetical protein [Nocardia sp. alder85J]|uniref:hypothetical protein n=1 Tax=Nocardia sp. alder85J TaxID=2862949 RepID=UPI001CD3A793|nr:hypothetical protein [Nocardia sp. alder85J]MCX4094409.1 hypothetical protein [Nocardia sp. alder85J]
MSPLFLPTTLVIVATPGTGALYTPAAGLNRGTLLASQRSGAHNSSHSEFNTR